MLDGQHAWRKRAKRIVALTCKCTPVMWGTGREAKRARAKFDRLCRSLVLMDLGRSDACWNDVLKAKQERYRLTGEW